MKIDLHLAAKFEKMVCKFMFSGTGNLAWDPTDVSDMLKISSLSEF
jgi:hypothetical protein